MSTRWRALRSLVSFAPPRKTPPRHSRWLALLACSPERSLARWFALPLARLLATAPVRLGGQPRCRRIALFLEMQFPCVSYFQILLKKVTGWRAGLCVARYKGISRAF